MTKSSGHQASKWPVCLGIQVAMPSQPGVPKLEFVFMTHLLPPRHLSILIVNLARKPQCLKRNLVSSLGPAASWAWFLPSAQRVIPGTGERNTAILHTTSVPPQCQFLFPRKHVGVCHRRVTSCIPLCLVNPMIFRGGAWHSGILAVTLDQLRSSRAGCGENCFAIKAISRTLGIDISLPQTMGNVVLCSQANGQPSGASTRITAAETGTKK